jgi:hypothetical protein
LTKKTTPFDKLLADAVDTTLLSLGDSAREAIYFHLNDKFKIARDEIPNRVKDFDNGLEKIFGNGARFLEILIMKKLYEEMGKPSECNEKEDLAFLNRVAIAKQSYFETNK